MHVFRPRKLEIESRIKVLAQERGYPLDVTTAQRTLGPRNDDTVPPHGTEVYVSKIPKEIFEDKLFPLFETAGNIYKFRLMMSPSGISNRGAAFVTYTSADMAMGAIEMFDQMEIAPGHFIEVQKSIDNRRLFIGGIPEDKTKDQVWQELHRIGMRGIMEVIMYRSYIDRNRNRGFVFVEFSTHEEGARVRLDYKNAFIFGNRVQIDWSAPLHTVDDNIMKRVTKLFLRNLNVLQEPEEFSHVVIEALGFEFTLEKIYKCRDYAFVHFVSRRDAQRGLCLLREYFKGTNVEVTWAKPAPKKWRSSNGCAITGSPNNNKPKYGHHKIPALPQPDYNNNNELVPISNSPIMNGYGDGFTARRYISFQQSMNPTFSFCQNCMAQLTENDLLESSRRTFESLNL